MFYGRNKELTELNQLWKQDQFEMIIVYGRRRVGKTSLINEFSKDKKAIYYIATESSASVNLKSFSSACTQLTGHTSSTYDSYEDLFDELYQLSLNQRIVVAIDEYPYLAKVKPEISSLLQKYIDTKFKETKMMLILCGSSMSFMENQVLGYQSPLYGRRTAQFKIEPFDYKDTGNMLPQYTNEEKAIIYGITGGIPLYVNFFTRHHQLKEALLEEVFKSSAYLFEEPSNLLKQELREAARYNAIIEAIANGHTRLNEIATKVNIETGLCSTYLNKLIELNIVKKEKPVDYKASKKTFYRICDPLFSFWFSFVANNLNLISTGMIEKYYEPLIADKLHSYMGRIFEDMCKTYLQKYEKQLPIIPSEIGQWWGANPIKKCECEFDIVILSHDKKDCILGECKFKDKMIDIGTAKELSENSEDIFTDLNKYYYLFSLSGFTEHLLKQQNERLRLVTLDDLYQ